MRNRKLRYYLRGLGVGIFVSVLILCLTQKGQETLTDEQVRERAVQLGMVDSAGVVLADLQKDAEGEGLTEDKNGTDNLSGEESSEMTPDTANVESLDETQTEESREQSGADGTQTEDSREQSDIQNPEITVEIQKGATSYSVSKDLEDAGLIESAKTFDQYLCDQGYSKSIRAGVYTIKSGESEAEIAKIITGKR